MPGVVSVGASSCCDGCGDFGAATGRKKIVVVVKKRRAVLVRMRLFRGPMLVAVGCEVVMVDRVALTIRLGRWVWRRPDRGGRV